MSTRVSIVLPTWNVKDLLAQAVASVCAQTFADWELLVVDDGSTDGSADMVANWPDTRVRVIRSVHTGNPALLRNLAVSAGRGEYIAFIDSDDLWEPDKLRVQIDALEADRRYAWCYSNTLPLDEHGVEVTRAEARRWAPYSGQVLPRLLRLEARVPASSVVVRREAFDRVGGFDPGAGPVEDYDLWFRLGAHYEALAIDQRLCSSRSRPDAYQADRVAAHRAWQRAYRRAFRSSSSDEVRAICRELMLRHRLNEALHLAVEGRRLAGLMTLLRAVPRVITLRVGWRAVAATLARIVRPDRGATAGRASSTRAMEPAPAILQIYRDPVIPGCEAAYRTVEEDAARICVELGCPHPHLAIESVDAPVEVWWLNAYESDGHKDRVYEAYARNGPLMQALETISARKAGLTGPAEETFVRYRADLSDPTAWRVAGARFIVVTLTRSAGQGDDTEPRLRGAVFDAADGRRFTLRTGVTRADADALAGSDAAGARIFAVRPWWGMPAREWIEADPGFWTVHPASAGEPLPTGGASFNVGPRTLV